MLSPFFPLSQVSDQGNYSRLISQTQKKRKTRFEIRSALWFQSCKSALGQKSSNTLEVGQQTWGQLCLAGGTSGSRLSRPFVHTGSVFQGSENSPLWMCYQTSRDACHSLAFHLLKITNYCQIHRVCNLRKCHKQQAVSSGKIKPNALLCLAAEMEAAT